MLHKALNVWAGILDHLVGPYILPENVLVPGRTCDFFVDIYLNC
jgi:hypothetical protein